MTPVPVRLVLWAKRPLPAAAHGEIHRAGKKRKAMWSSTGSNGYSFPREKYSKDTTDRCPFDCILWF